MMAQMTQMNKDAEALKQDQRAEAAAKYDEICKMLDEFHEKVAASVQELASEINTFEEEKAAAEEAARLEKERLKALPKEVELAQPQPLFKQTTEKLASGEEIISNGIAPALFK